MQRYFVKTGPDTDRFFIDGEDYHHITRVMRMKMGDEIVCITDENKSSPL